MNNVKLKKDHGSGFYKTIRQFFIEKSEFKIFSIKQDNKIYDQYLFYKNGLS